MGPNAAASIAPTLIRNRATTTTATNHDHDQSDRQPGSLLPKLGLLYVLTHRHTPRLSSYLKAVVVVVMFVFN